MGADVVVDVVLGDGDGGEVKGLLAFGELPLENVEVTSVVGDVGTSVTFCDCVVAVHVVVVGTASEPKVVVDSTTLVVIVVENSIETVDSVDVCVAGVSGAPVVTFAVEKLSVRLVDVAASSPELVVGGSVLLAPAVLWEATDAFEAPLDSLDPEVPGYMVVVGSMSVSDEVVLLSTGLVILISSSSVSAPHTKVVELWLLLELLETCAGVVEAASFCSSVVEEFSLSHANCECHRDLARVSNMCNLEAV